MESLGLTSRRKAPAANTLSRVEATYAGLLSDEHMRIMTGIVRTIISRRGISLDELPGATGADYRTIAELVGMLEIDGFISVDLLKRCSLLSSDKR
jgi:hypothetical protein